MIILLIGLVGSAVYGWWTHRKASSNTSPKA
jgi:hypothetical protein